MDKTLKVQALTALNQLVRPTGHAGRADGESKVIVKINNPAGLDAVVADLHLESNDFKTIVHMIQTDEDLARRVVEYYERTRKSAGSATAVIEE